MKLKFIFNFDTEWGRPSGHSSGEPQAPSEGRNLTKAEGEPYVNFNATGYSASEATKIFCVVTGASHLRRLDLDVGFVAF
jgi:hypothetical protein